jgi:molybdate transport system substrate-binding protein
MMSRRKLICTFAALATTAAVSWSTLRAPAQAQGGDVVIFAAASLTDALDAINAEWQKETGKKATVSYAASSVLAKQIEQDSPAQIFVSADLDWMDYVEQRRLIKPESRVNLLGNRIVLIARKDIAQPIEIRQGFDLAKIVGRGYLAVANVDSVPAGKYAKAALEKLAVWPSVADKLAQSADVRAALLRVSRGQVPVGIVYQTDAVAREGVRQGDQGPASAGEGPRCAR